MASSNNKISINGKGLAIGIEPGEATLFYTVTNGVCESKSSKNFTVFDKPKISRIFFGTPMLNVGNSCTYSVNPSMPNGRWSVDNENLLMANGTVKANHSGETIITYSANLGNCKSDVALTVTISKR